MTMQFPNGHAGHSMPSKPITSHWLTQTDTVSSANGTYAQTLNPEHKEATHKPSILSTHAHLALLDCSGVVQRVRLLQEACGLLQLAVVVKTQRNAPHPCNQMGSRVHTLLVRASLHESNTWSGMSQACHTSCTPCATCVCLAQCMFCGPVSPKHSCAASVIAAQNCYDAC